MTQDKKPLFVLNNWYVTETTDGMDPNYTPPECWRTAIGGEIVGDSEIEDNTNVVLPPIIHFDREKRIVESLTSLYQLKTIDENYEKMFVGENEEFSVEERVFNALDVAFS